MTLRKVYMRILFLLLLACFSAGYVFSQPMWTFDPFGKASQDTKSEEYKERLLPSERTADKKFTVWRKFVHNNTTRYNYHFNAKNKLNTVIEMAKDGQQDDYSKLLSFYPYSLDNTSSQATELDSVIYKSTAGILTHDLRTEWVDNLYLLIGQSYFFRKDFDSAVMTFQFINYNLFPRKKKEDENRVVGENERAGSGTLSIADREKRNLVQKMLTLPPSRNDALIWLARTFIEQEKYGEAAGLISILQNDPNLPKRLKPNLDEVYAYWFYRQQQFDSSAVYLEKSLKGIKTKVDRSRQLFLMAQLYEMTKQFDKASSCYNKSASQTPSPLMDINARLNNAKMLRTAGNIKELDKSIAELEKMGSKDKYEAYRDIIFYSAGMLSIQRPDTVKAIQLFQKSLKKNESNEAFRQKAHLMLGKIAYEQKNYKEAADHYDSLDVALIDPLTEDTADIGAKKNALRRVADFLADIQQADSLLMLASLSPDQLDIWVKKEVRKAKRAARDSKDAEEEQTNNLSMLGSDNSRNGAMPDLFGSSGKGEWYFYNASAKSKGFGEFQSRWGKRPNTDNWRRKSAMAMSNSGPGGLGGTDDPMNAPADTIASPQAVDNSYDGLIANVPLKDEQKASMHQRVTDDLVGLAQIFEMELMDYRQALGTYDIFLQRYPDSLRGGQIFLSMFHCYEKLGDKAQAAYYRHLLDSMFSDSKYVKMVNDPASLQPEKNNPTTEKMYQQVFDLMRVENYDSALALKEKMDCDFGDHYWTPQLLYMWAICAIKCTTDSQAIYLLQSLIGNYPGTPLAQKAENLVDVLQRRAEIESYLSGTPIVRTEAEPKKQLPTENPVALNQPAKGIPQQSSEAPKLNEDKNKEVKSSTDGTFIWSADKPHVVIMLLEQVDPVYVNESVRAFNRLNAQKNKRNIAVTKKPLTTKYNSLQFSGSVTMNEALEYLLVLKKSTPIELSWLPAEKYKFILVSEDNLTKLTDAAQLDAYMLFLHEQLPDNF